MTGQLPIGAGMRVVHWFRNDLRVRDNTALRMAAGRASELLPIFVIDQALFHRHAAPRRRSYLAATVAALAADLRAADCPLLIAEGNAAEIIPRLVADTHAELLTFNRDYSPYAVRRDRHVENAVRRLGARVESYKDRVVFEANEILTRTGTGFQVYTPYRNAWLAHWQRAPQLPAGPFRLPPRVRADTCIAAVDRLPDRGAPGSDFAVGEAEAATRLAHFVEGALADYAGARDRPAADGTSRLSAALRFGAVSVRTCIAAAQAQARHDRSFAGGAAKWVEELIWRDFYQALLATHPRVLGGAYQRQYSDIEWNRDEAGFAAWCRGETGFPFVDAAMRQLVTTGWMHNRARMVVASFLVKDLLIDWRRGERFFMHHLIDGDPAANNGGWQWAASTGTDAQPYFRIFNPVAQGRRYDPDGDYTRRYVPELADLPARLVHEPAKAATPRRGYPAPIVDHGERRLAAIARFAASRERSRSG